MSYYKTGKKASAYLHRGSFPRNFERRTMVSRDERRNPQKRMGHRGLAANDYRLDADNVIANT